MRTWPKPSQCNLTTLFIKTKKAWAQCKHGLVVVKKAFNYYQKTNDYYHLLQTYYQVIGSWLNAQQILSSYYTLNYYTNHTDPNAIKAYFDWKQEINTQQKTIDQLIIALFKNQPKLNQQTSKCDSRTWYQIKSDYQQIIWSQKHQNYFQVINFIHQLWQQLLQQIITSLSNTHHYNLSRINLNNIGRWASFNPDFFQSCTQWQPSLTSLLLTRISLICLHPDQTNPYWNYQARNSLSDPENFCQIMGQWSQTITPLLVRYQQLRHENAKLVTTGFNSGCCWINFEPKITWDQIVAKIIPSLAPLGSTYQTQVQAYFDHAIIDWLPRTNKLAQTYVSAPVAPNGMAYVSINYDQSLVSILELIKALGTACWYQNAAKTGVYSQPLLDQILGQLHQLLWLDYQAELDLNRSQQKFWWEQRLDQTLGRLNTWGLLTQGLMTMKSQIDHCDRDQANNKLNHCLQQIFAPWYCSRKNVGVNWSYILPLLHQEWFDPDADPDSEIMGILVATIIFDVLKTTTATKLKSFNLRLEKFLHADRRQEPLLLLQILFPDWTWADYWTRAQTIWTQWLISYHQLLQQPKSELQQQKPVEHNKINLEMKRQQSTMSTSKQVVVKNRSKTSLRTKSNSEVNVELKPKIKPTKIKN